MIRHDLVCRSCETVERDVWVKAGEYGTCACGGERTWVPRALNTDLLRESAKENRAFGREFLTTRDAEKHAAKLGLEPAGDLVHGARELPKMGASRAKSKDVASTPAYRAYRDAVARNAESLRRLPKNSRLRRSLEPLTP